MSDKPLDLEAVQKEAQELYEAGEDQAFVDTLVPRLCDEIRTLRGDLRMEKSRVKALVEQRETLRRNREFPVYDSIAAMTPILHPTPPAVQAGYKPKCPKCDAISCICDRPGLI